MKNKFADLTIDWNVSLLPNLSSTTVPKAILSDGYTPKIHKAIPGGYQTNSDGEPIAGRRLDDAKNQVYIGDFDDDLNDAVVGAPLCYYLPRTKIE